MKCLTAVFVSLAFSLSHSADWPHWLGPDFDGKSAELVPEGVDLSQTAWTAEIGIGFSTVSVADGRVFTMGHEAGKETVWCLSEKDGSVIWSDSYPAELMPNLHEGGPGSTPTVDGDLVYTISKDGQLRTYEAGTGKVFWSKNMMDLSGLRRAPEWGFTGSAVIHGDLVLIEAGAIFAFEKTSGKLKWQSEDYRPAYGSAQIFEVGEKTFIATLKTDGLVILDPENGKTLGFSLWRTSFQTNSTTPLDLGDGKLFISTGYDQGCALFQFNGTTLTKLYENKNMCNHMGNSVLIDGKLYGFDGTAHRGRPVEFTCIDAMSGEKLWHFPDLKYGSVIAAGKDLIVLTETGEMLIGQASPKGFEARARHQVMRGRCWTPPVIANGRIYVRNATGRLVAISVGDK
ncbi:MAG: PQQ-binding-like beta-propeller repeat protein [Verrucomicrobiales bacterium]|nr:PQQ-binding-like beta-propeller repeat protein [Verrucomicrobiales bacterium]